MAEQSERDVIAEVLRSLAPGHTVTRIWGRLDGATPEQAQEGNAWAADPEDIADVVLDALNRARKVAGQMPCDPISPT